MEAISSGVPVVASDISGIPEFVEHEGSGLLVPPRDRVALSDALRRLPEDPSRCRRLGLDGRQEIVDAFNLEATVSPLARHVSASLAS